jgi:large subunit ribosomal protein L5
MKIADFKERYRTDVVPKMEKAFSYENAHAVPRIEKVVVNVGFGKNGGDEKFVETVHKTLERITGQKPVDTKARKSISGFKVREGQVVGARVTLRGKRMEDFVEKLIRVTLPRVRDFRGLSTKSFARGERQYTIGFAEHNVFPEIKSDEVELLHGLEVTIVTTAKTPKETRELLTLLGFPFQKEKTE